MISRSPARGVVIPRSGGRGEIPLVIDLRDTEALGSAGAGVKATNLAVAAAGGFPVLPGFVVLPHPRARRADLLREPWAVLSADGRLPLVVRSSSSAEDGESSSMAGRFTSVVDVRGWYGFLDAVEAVVASGEAVEGSSMAVLVQPLLDCAVGGVMFGVDPVSGRRDRLVVAATEGGPDRLVSGAVSGTRYTLTTRGHLVDVDGDGVDGFPSVRQRLALVRLARRAAAAFGGPQDIEFAFDHDGRLFLFQSRPVTAVAARFDVTGPRFGPGPVAETFPDPLSRLEQDLWIAPLGQALALTLRLAGTANRKRIDRSPVVVAPGGRVAVDLDLVEGETRGGLWARIDPRPPMRRLAAAWRVGRLRAALPALSADLVARADADMAAVPPLDSLPDEMHLRLLSRATEALVALHAQEMLAGLLHRDPRGEDSPTAARLALRRLVAGRVDDLSDPEIVARYPEVLALTVPRVGAEVPLPTLASGPLEGGASEELGPREALRLRCRWTHELMARSAYELGRRLCRRGVLPDPQLVRGLGLHELETAVLTGKVPDGLASRQSGGPPLPPTFRLAPDGTVVAVPPAGRARRRGNHGPAGAGRPAGGGRAVGAVHHGAGSPPDGSVLVVRTLDPALAVHLPRLGGLVAETGSVLSHLAILAREFGIPTVVGVSEALERFEPGAVVLVDGSTGEVVLMDGPA